MSVNIKYKNPVNLPIEEVILKEETYGGTIRVIDFGHCIRIYFSSYDGPPETFIISSNSASEFFEACAKMSRQAEGK